MENSIRIIKEAFDHRSPIRLPKGELWLGTALLGAANLADDLDGHRQLIRRLGHDTICLPVSAEKVIKEDMGYRYFDLQELDEASRIDDLFVMALINGPFQRLVEKRGLINVLTEWRRERYELEQAYEQERSAVDSLIKACIELRIDAIVIADDVAGERDLFIGPEDIHQLCSSFYTQAVSAIHGAHAYALLHSCGNITKFIPYLISYGFDGLAGIQHRSNNLVSVKEKWGTNLTLMAGIEVDFLEREKISLSAKHEYEEIIRSLIPNGAFIICSSSGLYSGGFLETVQELYRIADHIYTA